MFRFEGMKIKFSRTKAMIAMAVIVAVVCAVPFLLPSFFYQGLIEKRFEQATGLDFSFNGNFDLSIAPSIDVVAKDVTFNGTLASGLEIVGSIDEIELNMQSMALLTGKVHVEKFNIWRPNATLNGDVLPHVPEWLRESLRAARKDEVRYLEVLQHFIEKSVFEDASLSEGTFAWNKNDQAQIQAQKINLNMQKPSNGKDFTIDGNMYVNNRSLDMALRLQRPNEFMRGFRSKLQFKLDSAPFKVEFDGTAAQRSTFVAQGDLRVDVPSLFDFCVWYAQKPECEKYDGNLLIKTDLKLRDQKLQFENATYTQYPIALQATGGIDFKYNLPEISGTITVPVKSHDDFLPKFETLKAINFENLLIDAFNANVNVDYQGVRLPNGTIIQPALKAVVEQGRFTLTAKPINLFGGISNARFRWYKGIDKGYMDLRVDVNGLDFDQIKKGLNIDFPMSGALKSNLEIQSEGDSVVAFIETARINGDFTMLDGLVHNPDVAESLTGQATNRFEFTEAKGIINGNRGLVQVNPIKVTSAFVDISGQANVDLLGENVDFTLNSIFEKPDIEDPDAATNGFVKVSGPFDNIVLSTSVSGEVVAPLSSSTGRYSGLVPIGAEEEEIVEPLVEEEEYVLEEADLLD